MPGVHLRVARRLLCGCAMLTTGLALAACGSGSGRSTTTTSATVAHNNASRRQIASTGGGGSSAGHCSAARQPVPKGAQSIPKPTLKLDPTKSYVVTLNTNCGSIAIELDVRQAPLTTSSFAYLVRRGFYNDLTFHRVAANFVIQGATYSAMAPAVRATRSSSHPQATCTTRLGP